MIGGVVVFFFFFQAEDGIRDWSVTGVQTCALPICLLRTLPGAAGGVQYVPKMSETEAKQFIQQLCTSLANPDRLLPGGYLYMTDRSEERRVGKECRYRWWPDH